MPQEKEPQAPSSESELHRIRREFTAQEIAHIGVLATGDPVVVDPRVFARIREQQ